MDGDEDLTCEILEEGDIGATLGLILHLLPNLRRLTVTDFNERSIGMGNLQQILSGMLINNNKAYGEKSRAPSVQPLSKLKHITFTRSDQGMHGDQWDLAMWAPLFYLPSIRSVRAEYVRASTETFHYPEQRSAIAKLVFEDPEIDMISLNTYVKDIKSLRHFEVQDIQRARQSRELRPRLVAETLLAYAAHSLQYLKIRNTSQTAQSVHDGAFFIGSLQAFRSLRTLCLEAFMFIESIGQEEGTVLAAEGPTAGRYCSLINVLPKSAVHICLLPQYGRDAFGVDRSLAGTLLEDLPGRRAELLPNLRWIEFLCGIELDRLKGSVVAKKCSEVGIELSDQHGCLN
ncbi:MAG: hypothetical protein Q9169_007654 [Polycauliona sp. 2 TL-2023]